MKLNEEKALRSDSVKGSGHTHERNRNPVQHPNAGLLRRRKRSYAAMPWLNSSAVEISTEDLKEICRTWDLPTWNAYLDWYESPLREKLLKPEIYDKLCEQNDQTIFEQASQSNSDRNRIFCEKLLESLPENEKKILRLIFFEGRTIREIAALINISKSSAYRTKVRALRSLKYHDFGGTRDICHFMRGVTCASFKNSRHPLKEAVGSDIISAHDHLPNRRLSAFARIRNPQLRSILSELPERQQAAVYLRFWCRQTTSFISRELGLGTNVVDQILSTAVFKIKSLYVQQSTFKNKE